jgi:hypothetical protein
MRYEIKRKKKLLRQMEDAKDGCTIKSAKCANAKKPRIRWLLVKKMAGLSN